VGADWLGLVGAVFLAVGLIVTILAPRETAPPVPEPELLVADRA
jgi:hypothetical protein